VSKQGERRLRILNSSSLMKDQNQKITREEKKNLLTLAWVKRKGEAEGRIPTPEMVTVVGVRMGQSERKKTERGSIVQFKGKRSGRTKNLQVLSRKDTLGRRRKSKVTRKERNKTQGAWGTELKRKQAPTL